MASQHEHPDVTVSPELRAPVGPGVELCYQTFGSPDDEPLLLVMGLGGAMNWWPSELCSRLARAGFHVIRYDNRDTGRSTRLPGRVRRTQLVRGFATGRAPAPYGMADLAGDALGLLDHLGLPSAHVAGVSMGGMVAQTVAVLAPDRVRSLSSIMSTTGRRAVGWQSPRLLPGLVTPRRPGRESYVRTSVATATLVGSPAFPTPAETAAARAAESFERGVSNSGVMRQMMAILTQPDRTPALRRLTVPTLVLHGRADRMVHVSGGRATAAAIPGAELVLIDGMGHDLPAQLFDTFVAAIRRTADRAHRDTP